MSVHSLILLHCSIHLPLIRTLMYTSLELTIWIGWQQPQLRNSSITWTSFPYISTLISYHLLRDRMSIVPIDQDRKHNITFFFLRFASSFYNIFSFNSFLIHAFLFSVSLSKQKYNVGQINSTELTDAIWKNFFQGKLTYTQWTKGGEAMSPIVSPTGGTLLVRKLANLSPT